MGKLERHLTTVEGLAGAEVEAIKARQGQAMGKVVPRLAEEHKRPLIRLLRAVKVGEDPEGDLDAMRAAWAHLLSVADEEELAAMLPLPGMREKVEQAVAFRSQS